MRYAVMDWSEGRLLLERPDGPVRRWDKEEDAIDQILSTNGRLAPVASVVELPVFGKNGLQHQDLFAVYQRRPSEYLEVAP